MQKKVYWISTGLLCALMIFSAGMYLFQHGVAAEMFSSLGYPTHIIYPLAIAKILAVVAILTKKSAILKEWAYAGLCFDFTLASTAHLVAQDGEFAGAVAALILLLTSYFLDKKLFATQIAEA